MDQPLIDHLIANADLPQLKQLHTHYRALANRIGYQISKIEQQTHSRALTAHRLGQNTALARLVLKAVESGLTRDEAYAKVASEHGTSIEALKVFTARQYRSYHKQRVSARQDKTANLARLNLTNRQIADMLGVSVATVVNDLTAHKKRAG